jgi:hypothetical protein
MRKVVIGVVGLLLLANAAMAQVVRGGDELAPNGKGWGVQQAPGKARPTKPGGSNNGISYHGGPVMLGTTNVYYIWYGDWSGNTANSILTNLAQKIGGSPYFNINTTYYNGSNTKVSNAVN